MRHDEFLKLIDHAHFYLEHYVTIKKTRVFCLLIFIQLSDEYIHILIRLTQNNTTKSIHFQIKTTN